MFLFSFFKSLIGNEVIVELKNGLMIRGKLFSVDHFHNIKLTEMTVVNPEEFPHMASVNTLFVRGSVIRHMVLPSAAVDLTLLQDSCRRAHKRPGLKVVSN